MLYDPRHVLGLHSVEHVEEVRPIDNTSIWKVSRQVPHDSLIPCDSGQNVFDRDLIVVWGVNGTELSHLEQVFFTTENQLEEVLVELVVRGQVELTTSKH